MPVESGVDGPASLSRDARRHGAFHNDEHFSDLDGGEGNQEKARAAGRRAMFLSPSVPGFWDGTMTTTATTIRLPRLGGRPEECDTMELPQTGGCQCGGVRYEITQAPVMVYTCHCTDCQRMTSSAFSLGCVLPDGAFRLVRGEPNGVHRTTGSGRVSTR